MIICVFFSVCESDMLVEIAGVSMVGATLEDAARVLRNAGKSVRWVITNPALYHCNIYLYILKLFRGLDL